MERIINIAFYLLIISFNVVFGNNVAKQTEFTVVVRPGEVSCFYETVKSNQIIYAEYQVIDSDHGDYDISFEIKNPDGYVMESDYKKSDNIHQLSVHADGVYGFCIDNSFSVYSSKTIFFELIIEWDKDANVPQSDEFSDFKDTLAKDSQFDFTQQKIQDMYNKAVETSENMHRNLNAVKHHLDIKRSTEARDRNLSEANNFRVGAWSAFQIILMCIVGSIQVYMLRSLFETDPRMNIWNKFKILKRFN